MGSPVGGQERRQFRVDAERSLGAEEANVSAQYARQLLVQGDPRTRHGDDQVVSGVHDQLVDKGGGERVAAHLPGRELQLTVAMMASTPRTGRCRQLHWTQLCPSQHSRCLLGQGGFRGEHAPPVQLPIHSLDEKSN